VKDKRPDTGSVLVEACVTTVEEAVASVTAGARRLELCQDLDVGGLTPDVGVLAEVRAAVDVPVFAMARPRAGAFVFESHEVTETAHQIDALVEAGAHGIVLGLMTQDRRVDRAALERLVPRAHGLPITFHRAFDEAVRMQEALAVLAGSGVHRVLTSGGGTRARDGVAMLSALVRHSDLGVEILAGGGVRGDHVVALVESTGVREVHARAAGVPGVVEALRG
jgi:copper homeostasis protein